MKTKVLTKFKKLMTLLAKESECNPADITKTQYFASEHKDLLTEWDLRKLGGFDSVKKLVFQVGEEEDLSFTSGSKMIKAHKNTLKEKYGKRLFAMEEMSNLLSNILKESPIQLHKPLKKSPSKGKPASRTLIAHLSDTHYGCNIDKDEVGVNEFNWTIASRRTALFAEQIANYKPQYRKDTDLILCINGDIIAGMIHNQEWFADLLTLQYAGTVHILAQKIGYLATNFSKVKVVCSPGNHGRAMHKASHDRATTHKWDSYETIIYLGIKAVVEAKYPNVTVEVPMTPYSIFEAQGHLFFLSHGDTVFDVGNPGSSLNMRSINTQITKLNASEVGGNGRKFEAVIVGHVHTPTIQLTESGCMLIINGCLSGVDPYAQAIGIFESNPTQQFFEVTKDHAVGDIRLIQLKSADTQTRLDGIIAPFKGKIS